MNRRAFLAAIAGAAVAKPAAAIEYLNPVQGPVRHYTKAQMLAKLHAELYAELSRHIATCSADDFDVSAPSRRAWDNYHRELRKALGTTRQDAPPRRG